MNSTTTAETTATANDMSAGTMVHATTLNSPLVPGRRAFFTYRDLMVAAATGGKLRAQVMSSSQGLSQPTGWHYHVCEAQFIYALKGWVDLEFEDGRTIRLQAGESMLIPGGMKHNEIATSTEFELLEVTLPGEMGTVPCDKPDGLA
ncbi:MAG: cupin domain-containing protein [Burkholderiales bacterium]|nr:cupin domain-containing protein [Burkholderiales bacterium]